MANKNRIENLKKQLRTLKSYVNADLTLDDVCMILKNEIERLEKIQ